MLGLEDKCFINLTKVAYEGWGSQMYKFLLVCDFWGTKLKKGLSGMYLQSSEIM